MLYQIKQSKMIRKLFMILPILILLFSSCSDIDFDSEKWKNWEEKESNMHMRWDMVDDLIANYLNKGMKLDEVENLIGKVTLDTIQNEIVAHYDLGPCRRGINYGTLTIKYNQSKVISFEKSCN
ncbi:MAG: hypothetical protein CVT94_08855 [Bacteroidetes bacterium HGW-Bacteroidetes-11]|nr:MAG: hypothetical protein CVT94_08855 [Bacteroidetes bacterium HGW-Bacteroidetes-11]